MLTEIINIGDELLIGQVINTNASWMSEQLNLAGFPVARISVIPDEPDEIMTMLKESGSRSDIVLITGGLGPTKDDLTKDTLCSFFKTRLIFDENTFQTIEKFFGARGIPVTEVNRRQAEVPENCIVIPNNNGTAPGMWFEEVIPGSGEKRIFVSMPGVPFEMKAMLTEKIIPKLKENFKPVEVLHHTLLTQGIGESFLSDLLENWENHLPNNLHLAYLPQPGIVRLRLTGKGTDVDEAELRKQMDSELTKLRELAGKYIFGEGEDTLESIAGRLLKEQNATIVTAESCTGGYIAHLITCIPGSSDYYKGSIIAYSDEIKTMELGIPEKTLSEYGAVSEEVVKQMAENVRSRLKSDYSIAVSGIAGPGGGTIEKPVGLTWIAVAGPLGVTTGKYFFGDNRERNIRRTALQALNLLRKHITEV